MVCWQISYDDTTPRRHNETVCPTDSILKSILSSCAPKQSYCATFAVAGRTPDISLIKLELGLGVSWGCIGSVRVRDRDRFRVRPRARVCVVGDN